MLFGVFYRSMLYLYAMLYMKLSIENCGQPDADGDMVIIDSL